MIIQKVLKLKGAEYYKKHLGIINPLLPVQLTDKEIDILGEFMSLDVKITEDDRFNTLARNRVKTITGHSSGSLGNHLKSMIKKQILSKSEVTGKITIAQILFPEEKQQGYRFKFIKE